MLKSLLQAHSPSSPPIPNPIACPMGAKELVKADIANMTPFIEEGILQLWTAACRLEYPEEGCYYVPKEWKGYPMWRFIVDDIDKIGSNPAMYKPIDAECIPAVAHFVSRADCRVGVQRGRLERLLELAGKMYLILDEEAVSFFRGIKTIMGKPAVWRPCIPTLEIDANEDTLVRMVAQCALKISDSHDADVDETVRATCKKWVAYCTPPKSDGEDTKGSDDESDQER